MIRERVNAELAGGQGQGHEAGSASGQGSDT